MFTQEDIDDLRGEAEGALPDEITIELFVSQDAYNKPTYSSPITVDCLIESYNELVRTSTGQERVAATRITIMPLDGLNEKARITLPDGSHPLILRIDDLVQSAWTIQQKIYTVPHGGLT